MVSRLSTGAAPLPALQLDFVLGGTDFLLFGSSFHLSLILQRYWLRVERLSSPVPSKPQPPHDLNESDTTRIQPTLNESNKREGCGSVVTAVTAVNRVPQDLSPSPLRRFEAYLGGVSPVCRTGRDPAELVCSTLRGQMASPAPISAAPLATNAALIRFAAAALRLRCNSWRLAAVAARR